jgi:hypothetical protein
MADIKQYVNLDPENATQLDGLDKARAGTRVVFEAKLTEKKEGVAVEFVIVRGDNNLFEPGGVTKRTTSTNKEGKALLPFDLTENGGDEFYVKSSIPHGKSTKVLGSDTYIVWRRLYYQMSRFKAGKPGANQPPDSIPELPAFDLDAVKAELVARAHNIELVDKSSKPLIKRHANVLTRDNNSKVLKTAVLDGYDPALVPVTLRILIVNQIAEVATESATVYGIPPAGREDMYIDKRLFQDLTYDKDADWFVEASWRLSDPPDSPFKPLGLKYFDREPSGRVYVDFTHGAPWKLEDAADVDVKLTYRYASGFCNGTSLCNSVSIASKTSSGANRTAADMTDTAVHEIGHFAGMVPVGQTTYYMLHGHNGNHCSTGLSEGELGRAHYTALNGTCIMYGEGGGVRRSVFCEACDPSLRASDVQRGGVPKSPAVPWT